MRRERSNLCWKMSFSSILLQFFIAKPIFFPPLILAVCCHDNLSRKEGGKKLIVLSKNIEVNTVSVRPLFPEHQRSF